jgi:hypothetical protein
MPSDCTPRSRKADTGQPRLPHSISQRSSALPQTSEAYGLEMLSEKPTGDLSTADSVYIRTCSY